MDEIEDMTDTILNRYHKRWPTDIIDQVFVAIEMDPGFLKRYHMFANGEYGTANSMIGRYVKEFTGMKSLRESDKPKSKLIKGFTLLGW